MFQSTVFLPSRDRRTKIFRLRRSLPSLTVENQKPTAKPLSMRLAVGFSFVLLCGILSVFDGNPGKSLVPVIRVIILGMENWYDTKDRVERRDREGIIL